VGLDSAKMVTEFAAGMPTSAYTWQVVMDVRITGPDLPTGYFDHHFDLKTKVKNSVLIPPDEQ